MHFPPATDENKAAPADWLDRWPELFINNLEEYAVFAIDLAGTVLTWQPGVARVLGYRRSAFVGLPAAIIFTASDREDGAPAQEMSVALEQGQALDERWHVRADGSCFWGSGVMLALRDEAGQPLGFAKIVRDRTQLRLQGQSLGLQTLRLEGDVAAQTQQIRALASDLTLAEQRERARISQLLHDELQQQLYALRMLSYNALNKVAGKGAAPGSADGLTEALREIYELTHTSLAMTRTLVSELSPAALRHGRFGEALLWLCQHMSDRHGLEVTVSGTETCLEPSEALGVLLFQCVQELLFNVVKHARTDYARLCVRTRPSGFELEVWDEGCGFEIGAPGPQSTDRLSDEPDRELLSGKGFGLQSVQRRLEPFGGVVTVQSVPGSGTRVTLEVRQG